MDTQEIRTLKILEEIDTDQPPSQRDLAKRLNISLGLVNSFIKRLVNKGYFKVTTIPRNRVRYMLTPKGAAEKSRLTYEYIRYSFQFYAHIRQKLKNTFSAQEKAGAKKIAFYGSGELAEIAYISLQETAISLVAVFDNERVGKKFFGRTILNTANITEEIFDKLLLTTPEDASRVASMLVNEGLPSEKMVHID